MVLGCHCQVFFSISCMVHASCINMLYVTSFCHSLFLSFSMDPLFLLFPPLSPQAVGFNFSSATTPELLLKTFDDS